MLQRHSSRRNRLDRAVLNERLAGAASYDRIAGYFRSSLFEVAGEAVMGVSGKVRIVCNSDLDPKDLETAAAAQASLRQSWCAGRPEEAPPSAIPRYRALHEALKSGKLEVRVLPDAAFGLIHGKAGVVRRADGSATAFLGSVNESSSAWRMNYELLWEDDDPETVAWVQEEFDALWNDARAIDLAVCPFIRQDVERIIQRQIIEPAEWKAAADPAAAAASAAVETPVYRREQGLWPHQKYFARLALERHRLGGARLVLADQVGLGKTVQLAMAAMLMALAVSPLRHLLFAIRETAANDLSPEPGRQYLRDTFGPAYWQRRERFVGLLEWLAALGHAEGMGEWQDDSAAARILAGRLRNDQA